MTKAVIECGHFDLFCLYTVHQKNLVFVCPTLVCVKSRDVNMTDYKVIIDEINAPFLRSNQKHLELCKKPQTLRLSHNYNALLAFISEYIHFKTVQTGMLQ